MANYFDIPKEESVDLIVKTCLDEGVANPKQIAYILASAQHESGNFYYASEINGESQAKKHAYSGGANYFGRGYVQITHDENYAKFDQKLGLNGALVKNPSLAEQPDIAAKILVVGMRDGMFRYHDKAHKDGHDINEYINNQKTDYYNARNVVNGGHDKAKLVQAYAEAWEKKLPDLIQTAELRATPLFQQAQAQLRQLDDDHCRRHDPRLDNAAAAMAVSAYKQGMRHIDHVMSSRGGPGSPAPSLLAVQGEPNTVDAKYAEIDPKQALNTPVLESAKAYEQEKIRHYSEFQHAGPRGQEPSPITHASQPAAAQGQAPTRLRDFSDSSHPQNALYNTLKEGFPPHASAELLSHATAACYRSGIKQPLDLGHVVGKEGKIFFSSNSLFSPGTTIDVMQALPSVQQTMQQVQQFDQQRANDRAQSQAQNAAQANQQQGPMLGGP